MSKYADLDVTLIPAPDDPDSVGTAAYEAAVQLVKSSVSTYNLQRALSPQGTVDHLDDQLPRGWIGIVNTPIFTTLSLAGPAIGTVLGAWLHARYGRKVRLKIGQIEAEAQTKKEVVELIKQAQEIQIRNEPKKIIHEP